MASSNRPRFLAADHVSFTVPDLDKAVAFYSDAFGAQEMFRMGPLDAADLPVGADGRDWMASHVDVPGAALTLCMLHLVDGLNLQLVQYDKPVDRHDTAPRNCDAGGHHLAVRVDDVEGAARYLASKGCTVMDVIAIDAGPLAGKKNCYIRDPFGHSLELVD